MTLRRRSNSDAYDSDSSFSPNDDDVFDASEHSDTDTDITDVDEFDNLEIDVDDQVQLFDGNLHPPEYYRRGIEELNEGDFDGEDYSKGTEVLLDGIEEKWQR